MKSLKIDEISFVETPANLQPFLFWKRLSQVPEDQISKAADVSLKLAFETDGTADGTVVKVNGKLVPDLTSLSLSYSPVLPYDPRGPEQGAMAAGVPYKPVGAINLYCNYNTKALPDDNGVSETRSYQVTKNIEEIEDEKADPEDLAVLRLVTPVADDVDAALAKAIAPCARTIAVYRDDLPPTLAGAVEEIIRLACLTEEGAMPEIDVNKAEEKPKEEAKPDDQPKPDEAVAPAPASAPAQPASLSDEDVARIAAKVAEVMAASTPPPPAADVKADDPQAGQEDELEVDPVELGQELAQAAVAALNDKH